MPLPLTITDQPIFGLPTLARPQGVIVPPAMTSNTAPVPWVASASGEYNAGSAAWHAFCAPRVYNGWLNANGALPQWIALKFPYPFVVATYSLYPWWADNFPGRSPTAWTFQGSPDGGTTWLVLDTQTGQTWAAATTTKTYTVVQPVACTAFRLWITANGGNSYTGLGSFLFTGRRF